MDKGYKVLTNTENLSRSEWLSLRKNYLGGSDAGAVLGYNKYRSPLDVYQDKINKDEKQEEYNEAIRVGNDLESYVLDRLEEVIGTIIERPTEMFVSTRYPYLSANIDGYIPSENAVVEAKTTSNWNADKWNDEEIPSSYYCQVQHYMMVLGCEYGYIAVLIGNTEFKYYRVEADEDWQRRWAKVSKDFIENNVKKRIPPGPNGTLAYSNSLQRFKSDINSSDVLTLGQKEYNLISQYERLGKEIKRLEDLRSTIKAQLQYKLLESDTAIVGDKKITYKQVNSSKFDKKGLKAKYPEIYDEFTKENNYRTFRVATIKGEGE